MKKIKISKAEVGYFSYSCGSCLAKLVMGILAIITLIVAEFIRQGIVGIGG